MENERKILAKAMTPQLQSDAIVVSFNSNWYSHLRRKSFQTVIRKRVPRNINPKWIYFHINSPISAICARAEIFSIRKIDLPEALRIKKKIDLPEVSIREYFGKNQYIGCYHLGKIFFPKKEITIEQLKSRMIYHPPQSFFILSKSGKKLLDKFLGFSRTLPNIKLRNDCNASQEKTD